MMNRSGTGCPHSHGTPMDVVPTTAGITSTLNPLSQYYSEFQSQSCGNTANTATVSLFIPNKKIGHSCSIQSVTYWLNHNLSIQDP